MKCPLSNFVVESEDCDEKTLLLDCLTTDCAWWCQKHGNCVILACGEAADRLATTLTAIANRKSINVQLAK